MKRFFIFTVSVLFCIIIALLAVILILPKPLLLQDIDFSKVLYDDHQNLLHITITSDQQYRIYTPYANIPSHLIEATLLQEDRYFFFHPGINPIALGKAFMETYILRTRKRGASTIPMQLIRIKYKINTRTILGKLAQIFKALQIEFYYSKKQILEAYLNLAPYGGNVQGVGAASLIYFGKSINKLTISEILTLVVIPQNPIKRTPTLGQHQKLFQARNNLFLNWLHHYTYSSFLSDQKALMQLPLQLKNTREVPLLAPHFVFYVLQHYHHQDIFNTTLDLSLQNIITKIAKDYAAHHPLNNYAILLVDTRTMGVKAMVGSSNFFNNKISGQINGTNAKRSPGSALKPFIYALALQQGLIHPLSILKDTPQYFAEYAPENFDKNFEGPINATQALITSRNIPAITLMHQLKNPSFYHFLQEAHINLPKTAAYYGLSLALGDENITMQALTELYAMLVNNGQYRPLRFLSNDTKTVGKQLLSPEASFLVLKMLQSNPRPNAIASASKKMELPVYWKTGTSSHYRDAWTVGIFSHYVLAVWVGDFQNKTHQQFIGITTAAPLFFSIIDAIQNQIGQLSDIIYDKYKKLNLAKVKICEPSGLMPTKLCPKTVETWFIPGVSPIKKDNIFREILIDKRTGLRACKVSPYTTFSAYEIWPSDLENLFEQAGIHHPTPPPFEASCNTRDRSTQGLQPKIISPREHLVYSLHINSHENEIIPLIAIADSDVKTIYWFIDQTYIGKSQPNKSLLWKAKPGTFKLRAVDDFGRSDLLILKVSLIS